MVFLSPGVGGLSADARVWT